MKTKVVQHVERESEWESESCESSAFVWHSDIVWSLLRNVPGCCLYLQFHGVLCYNVWVTQLGDRDGRVTSRHDRVPLLQVSPCVTPHDCGKPKHDQQCKCILFVTMVFKFLNHHLHVQLLLNYSSFLEIGLAYYIIILLMECNINYLKL